MSIGKTFVSYDYGQSFLLSDGSEYIDTFKSPKPLSLAIEFIPPGSRQTIEATVLFNRQLDTTENFNVSSILGTFRYDGDEEIDGTFSCLSRGYSDDSYSITCEMAFIGLSGAEVDKLEYSYSSGNRIIGANGINVDNFSIEEENDYPTPIQTSVSVNGPKIEVLVTFNKHLDTSIVCDVDKFSINYNNIYVVLSCDYVSSTEILVVGNYTSAAGSNFLSYQSDDPYSSGSITGVNGVLVRTFKITI